MSWTGKRIPGATSLNRQEGMSSREHMGWPAEDRGHGPCVRGGWELECVAAGGPGEQL